METVVLELPPDIDKWFTSLSLSDKNYYYAFLDSWSNCSDAKEKERIESNLRLLKIMDEIGKEATARGMTEEIFNDIMKEALSDES